MESVEDMKLKGKTFDQNGDYKSAEQCYGDIIEQLKKESWEKCPDELANAYNNRGLSRYQQVHFHEAIEDFTQAIAMNNNLAFAFYNRGLINYRLGRFLKAVEDMDNALALEPVFESAQLCKKQSMEDILDMRK